MQMQKSGGCKSERVFVWWARDTGGRGKETIFSKQFKLLQNHNHQQLLLHQLLTRTTSTAEGRVVAAVIGNHRE